jgi:hypothetical protein
MTGLLHVPAALEIANSDLWTWACVSLVDSLIQLQQGCIGDTNLSIKYVYCLQLFFLVKPLFFHFAYYQPSRNGCLWDVEKGKMLNVTIRT